MIDINDLTIGQVKQLVAMLGSSAPVAAPAPKKLLIGEYVIVRCRDAGVHAGTLIDYEGRTVNLSNSRRLWRWHAVKGISLSDVAVTGIVPEKSRITAEVPVLTVMDACEIISTTEAAKGTIQLVSVAEKS